MALDFTTISRRDGLLIPLIFVICFLNFLLCLTGGDINGIIFPYNCLFQLICNCFVDTWISNHFSENKEILLSSINASIAVAFPFLLDYVMDLIRPIDNDVYESMVPRFEIAMIFIIPGIFSWLYILPYEQYEILVGVIDARDSCVICLFLYKLNKLAPEIFTCRSVFIIGILFAIGNILDSLSYTLSDNLFYRHDIFIIYYILNIIAFLYYSVIVYKWIKYIKLKNKTTITKNDQLCNIYLPIFSVILLFSRCFIGFFSQPPGSSWSTLSVNYMVTYTYVLIICFSSLIVFTGRISRQESFNVQVCTYNMT